MKDTKSVAPGDYLDTRTLTPVTIARETDGFVATWHKAGAVDDGKRVTAFGMLNILIESGILTATALTGETAVVS